MQAKIKSKPKKAKKVKSKPKPKPNKVEESIPQLFEVCICTKGTNILKDQQVGSISYSEKQGIKLDWYADNCGADLEAMVVGDILVVDGDNKYMISQSEEPEKWITELHKSALGGRYYASEVTQHNEAG